MDIQTKIAILAITVIIPISTFYVWNSDQSFGSASSDSTKISIIASFYPLYEFSREIGQNKVSVSLLVPPGIEPHDWEPTVSDMQKIHQSELIIINGIGFENWINDIDITNSDIIIVDTSKGISIIDNKLLDDDSDHHDEFNGDPHIWLNPVMAKIQVTNIANALASIDPANEKYYRENSLSYIEKLDLLDNKIKNELSSCNKDIIVFHNAFSYFTKEYGLNQHTIIKSSESNAEPSAKNLQHVINLAREYEIDVIFAEENFDTRISQVIADEINGKVLVLSPIEVVDKNSSYLIEMTNNLSNLKEALCN